MKIEPSGIVLTDVCSIQTEMCEAKEPAAITAVWSSPARVQINVCRPCLDEQVRSGEWEIPGAKIEKRADILVCSSDNRMQLIVEIKKRPQYIEDTRAWATKVYWNLLAHAGLPNVPYFMLVVPPEVIFLWKRDNYPDPRPNYEIEASNIFADYKERLSHLPDIQGEQYYSLVVNYWLKELTKKPPVDDLSYKWLLTSGLVEAINDGVIYVKVRIAV